jgi:hypothetical protein
VAEFDHLKQNAEAGFRFGVQMDKMGQGIGDICPHLCCRTVLLIDVAVETSCHWRLFWHLFVIHVHGKCSCIHIFVCLWQFSSIMSLSLLKMLHGVQVLCLLKT